ncbi:MAG: hypothetical protein ACKO0N_10795 [Planctomycetota bacterium]
MNRFLHDYLNRRLLALAFALILSSICFAQEPEPTRFSAPVAVPAAEKTSLASLTLDSRIYAAGSRGLADLRLFDSKNNLVAFIVRQQIVQRKERSTAKRSIASPELKFLEANGLEISFSIAPEKSPGPLNGLLIRTGLREFERRANLEWDQGKGEWTKLASDVLLYDYSSVIDLRNLEIRLPQPLEIRQLSKFRLTIDKVTEAQESQVVELTRRLRGANEEYREERLLVNRQPFRIEGLESSHETTRTVDDSPLKSNYPVKLISQEDLKESRCTVLAIESQGEPLTGFQLQTADDNFSRAVVIEAREPISENGNKTFREVAKGTISKVHLPGAELDRMELSLPETSSSSYRLIIFNLDSQPVKISSVTATGNNYQLFFLAQPGESYRVEYGGGEVEKPSFDTVAISTALQKRLESLPAKLGEATKVETAATPKPRSWTMPIWVFWLVAACLVALIGSGLYSAAKRVDGLE